MSALRECWTCTRRLPVGEFYRAKLGWQGRKRHCRDCTREKMRPTRLAYYTKNRAQIQAAKVEWQSANRARAYRSQRRWCLKNKEKSRAHMIVYRLVRDGKIKKPTRCPECGGRGRINGHHEDYSKEREIRWMCQPCHKRLHAKLQTMRDLTKGKAHAS